MPKCIVVEPAFSWGDDRPPCTPWSRTVIYECHLRGLTKRHPGVPEALRGTYLGLGMDPVLEHLLALGVTAVELMPVHHFVSEPDLVKRGLTNYWGYNSIAFFAPQRDYASVAGSQVAEFRTMVKRLHGVGHRGDPRRGLQPHGRGRRARPDAVAARHRQRVVLSTRSSGPAPLRRFHRLREQPQHGPPAHRPAHHGQPPLLGARDARGRLPLRPGARARARAVRGQPARHVLRHHLPGSGPLTGEAHRGALGPRSRRLPGGKLSGGLDGVERQVSRHGAPVLARRLRADGGPGVPADREQRPLRRDRAQPIRQHQLRHLPRRLHAARPRRATSTSTTRRTARATATAPTPTGAATGASRATPNGST